MRLAFSFCAVACLSAFASSAKPLVSDVRCRQRQSGSYRVSYRLSGEPAVVTADIRMEGVALPACDQTNMVGAVNARVSVGVASFVWTPPPSFVAPQDPNAITVALRAWATNTPPDYMVVDLTDPSAGARYYTAADRLPEPLSARRWRTESLVLRRIPAACREWRTSAYGGRQRHLTLSRDYYLGVFPVTVGQYANLLSGANLDVRRSNSYLVDLGIPVDPEWPKGQLSYEYLRGRRPKSVMGKVPGTVFWPDSGHTQVDATADLFAFRSAYGIAFDLPSEAEWEFACLGGIETNAAVNVAGASLDDVAWYEGNSAAVVTTNGGQTVSLALPHRVGEKLPNGYGLYDMLGNVFEFCLDWYDGTPTAPDRELDPVGPSRKPLADDALDEVGFDSPLRVRRGGGYGSAATACRPSARSGFTFTWDASYGAKYQNGCRLWAPAEAVK